MKKDEIRSVKVQSLIKPSEFKKLDSLARRRRTTVSSLIHKAIQGVLV